MWNPRCNWDVRAGDVTVTNQEAIKLAQTKLSLVFFVSSQALCVKLSVLFGVFCHYFNTKRTDMASKQWQAFRMCILPCPRYLNGRGYTQSLCCLFGRGACTVIAQEGCEHCDVLPLRTLRSHLAFFHKEYAQAHIPRGPVHLIRVGKHALRFLPPRLRHRHVSYLILRN